VKDAVTDVTADVSTLDQIERPRHHPEVDALLGRATWTSPMSLSSATTKRSHELSGSSEARTAACVMKISVEPCEVRAS
jgi:hypothetical protein